jgi:small subunit ribosomal protein S8
MTDPIADLLTRIRNAQKARHESCIIPASRVKEEVLKILKTQGFIKNYVRHEEKPQDKLVVFLRYQGKNRQGLITRLKRVSKPGCRVYRGYEDIKPLLGGLGFAILSTPQGVMTDKQARKSKLGGEVLCEVW